RPPPALRLSATATDCDIAASGAVRCHGRVHPRTPARAAADNSPWPPRPAPLQNAGSQLPPQNARLASKRDPPSPQSEPASGNVPHNSADSLPPVPYLETRLRDREKQVREGPHSEPA